MQLRTRSLAAAAAFLGLLATLPVTARAQAVLSLDSYTGGFRDDNTRMLGFQFSVSAPVTISALGWFDHLQDGLAREHAVGVWNAGSQALLGSTVVRAGTLDALQGHFRWSQLQQSLQLLPGVTYRIAGLDIGLGGDAHVWDANIGFDVHVTGFAADPRFVLTAGNGIGGLAQQFGFPGQTIGDARSVQMGPNLMLAPVPEPAAWVMLLLGLGALGLRPYRA